MQVINPDTWVVSVGGTIFWLTFVVAELVQLFAEFVTTNVYDPGALTIGF